jgi:hypothetical protein
MGPSARNLRSSAFICGFNPFGCGSAALCVFVPSSLNLLDAAARRAEFLLVRFAFVFFAFAVILLAGKGHVFRVEHLPECVGAEVASARAFIFQAWRYARMSARIPRWLTVGFGIVGGLLLQAGGCSILPNVGGLLRAFIPGTGG